MRRFKVLLVGLAFLTATWPAQGWAADEKSLEERLQFLEQELAIVKRQLELKKEDDDKAKKEAPIISASAKDGFSIKSPDESYKLKIRGLVQVDGRIFTDNDKSVSGTTSLSGTDTFLVRRARIILDGTAARDFDFYLAPDFGSGTNQLVDGYLEYKYFPKAKLRAGKFKVPLGLERLQSDTVANFIELGPTNNLTPNRDVGVQLSGDLLKETVNYAFGLFNGVADAGSSDGDTNNDKDFVARVFAHPFKNFDTRSLKGLGVGIAGSYGHKEGSTLPTYRSAGQMSIFNYSSTVSADGAHVRLSPQAYYYYNSLGLLAEYVSSEQKVIRSSGGIIRDSFKNKAWQVSGIYVLTGEDASYKGVIPKNPFDFKEKTWGAWGITGRYGQLDIDDSTFDNGFSSLSTSVSEADSWGLGLTWFLNRTLRTSLNFERTEFDGGNGAGLDRPTESIVFTRFQVNY
ncbi:MAG: porin [Candidatus Omnitrophica bacterium]|nr:porin [Candidatus Omnitrophota bacterium]